MDEGKATSDLFSVSEPDSTDDSGNLGKRLGLAGRLGSNVSSTLDIPKALPDEEESVAHVARRFRRPGTFGAAAFVAPTLDEQESEDVDAKELEGFVLEALENEQDKDSYVLEEVADETTRLDADQTDRIDGSIKRSHTTDTGLGTLTCPHCSASNPPGMRFCVQCGGSLQTSTKGKPVNQLPVETREPPPPTEAAKQANPWETYLVSINEDGSDGVVIQLEFLETTVGRDGDTRFPTDAFLSPKHARFHIEKGKLYIEDLYSLNGTFLKLRDEVKLTPGDTFLMGRQVLRFERFEQSISPKTKSSDGTRYMGSPAPGGSYKILQVGIGGIIQNVYCLPEAGAVLGREKGDIIFPHDKFMSSRHAQIYTGDDGHCYLVDLTSSNGTWIKLWEKTELHHNDYIFMGQQLFRIHIKDNEEG